MAAWASLPDGAWTMRRAGFVACVVQGQGEGSASAGMPRGGLAGARSALDCSASSHSATGTVLSEGAVQSGMAGAGRLCLYCLVAAIRRQWAERITLHRLVQDCMGCIGAVMVLDPGV